MHCALQRNVVRHLFFKELSKKQSCVLLFLVEGVVGFGEFFFDGAVDEACAAHASKIVEEPLECYAQAVAKTGEVEDVKA